MYRVVEKKYPNGDPRFVPTHDDGVHEGIAYNDKEGAQEVCDHLNANLYKPGDQVCLWCEEQEYEFFAEIITWERIGGSFETRHKRTNERGESTSIFPLGDWRIRHCTDAEIAEHWPEVADKRVMEIIEEIDPKGEPYTVENDGTDCLPWIVKCGGTGSQCFATERTALNMAWLMNFADKERNRVPIPE